MLDTGPQASSQKTGLSDETHTQTHTQTRHSEDISVLLADSQGGSNLIFGLDCGQESSASGRVDRDYFIRRKLGEEL